MEALARCNRSLGQQCHTNHSVYNLSCGRSAAGRCVQPVIYGSLRKQPFVVDARIQASDQVVFARGTASEQQQLTGTQSTSLRRPAALPALEKTTAAASASSMFNSGSSQLALAWGSSSSLLRTAARARPSCRPGRGGVLAAAVGGRDGGWLEGADQLFAAAGKIEEEAALERFDRCDLVEAFCWLAVDQGAWPREDVSSYMEPPQTPAAAPRPPSFPAWCEPLASMDSHEVIDWSDVENDGWGRPATEPHNKLSGGSGSSSNTPTCGGKRPAASASAVGAASGAQGGLLSCGSQGRIVSSSSSNMRRCSWGSTVSGAVVLMRPKASRVAATTTAAAAAAGSPCVSSRRNLQACFAVGQGSSGVARPEVDQSDDVPHYEGADSPTLFPPGCLELDDPGHPTDISTAGQMAADTQAAAVRESKRPYMNIVGGRWQPPSKAEAERMMQQLSQTGPDEGV